MSGKYHRRASWLLAIAAILLAITGCAHANIALLSSSLPAPGSSLNSASTMQLDSASARQLIESTLGPIEDQVAYKILWELIGDGANGPVGLASNEETAASEPLLAFISAVNDKFEDKEQTWETATAGSSLPSLRVVAAWWAEPDENSVPVTVITSGSFDRLLQLRAQCLSWQGPLSAVLFQAVLQHEPGSLTETNRAVLRLAVWQAAQLAAEMASTPGACQLSLSIVYELYTEESATALYPVNALRNLARLQARTPVVAMLDVDLLPSKSLYTRVSDPIKAAEIVKSVQTTKTAYIMPTFDLMPMYETPSWAEALTSAPNKGIMVYGMDQDMVGQFHGLRWPPGHNLTNFPRWKTAAEDYTVQYQNKCEPWVMGSRTLMPWHDARYRGFGLNKIQHVNNLASDGYQFVVLHDVYTIHRPHKHAEAEKMFMTKTSKNNKKKSSAPPANPKPSSVVQVVTSQEAAAVLSPVKTVKQPTMTLREHARSLYALQTATTDSGASFQAVVGPQLIYARSQLPWWNGQSHMRRLVSSTRTHQRLT